MIKWSTFSGLVRTRRPFWDAMSYTVTHRWIVARTKATHLSWSMVASKMRHDSYTIGGLSADAHPCVLSSELRSPGVRAWRRVSERLNVQCDRPL